MNPARLCWSAAALIAVVGMIWGIGMSASGNHTDAPAHAHLNLIGWVSLALYGTFYALSPAGTTRLALMQSIIAIIGTLAFAAGIAWVLHGGPHGPVAVASFIVLLGAVLFAYIVFTKPLRRSAA